MNRSTGPMVVIIVTVIIAFSSFLLLDHSGMDIKDVSIQEHNDSSNLTYYLRLGRQFNQLDCTYKIFDQNGEIISNGSTTLKNVYSGTHIISEIINSDKKIKPANVELNVYIYQNMTDETNNSQEYKTVMELNKSFNLTE